MVGNVHGGSGGRSSSVVKRSASSKKNNYSSHMAQVQVVLLIVVLFGVLVTVSHGQASTRCFTLCRRSEAEMGCRRCRFREPLRFGKRDPTASEIEDGALDLTDSKQNRVLLKKLRERLADMEPLVARLAALRGEISNSDRNPNNYQDPNVVDPV